MTFKDDFIKICEDNSLIGANIVVTNENNILEQVSYGFSNKESNVRSNSNTIYRIASISKTIGSIGLMMLVEKGLVDLDEDISKYLGYKVINPNHPDDIITVKMLTTQTSSILDGYDDENPLYDDIHKGYNGVNGTLIDVSLQDLLTNVDSPYYTPLTFAKYKPGERFCYSNFGCGIMACIIEKVSGELYVDYMENHIFKPLQLNASFKASHLEHQENIATMYSGNNVYNKERFINSKLPVYSLGNNFRGPAGGLFITMKDLSILMRVFLNMGTYKGVTLLKPSTVETMYEIQWIGYPKNDNYRAKGIQMKVIDTTKYLLRGHTGGAYGVRSYMYFNIKEKIGACFITNGMNVSNDSFNSKRVFKDTIDLWSNLIPISKNNLSKIVITRNYIECDNRVIKHHKLFINENFILAKALFDSLNILPLYDEDSLTLKVVYQDKEYEIVTFIICDKEIYINVYKALEKLNIVYQKENDVILLSKGI